MSFYVLDEHNNYVESMSKEEIIAAIQTAANGGKLEGFSNAAFVSKVKELNKNAAFGFWVGTQAEYNQITEKAKNVLYLISDDPLCNDLPNKVAAAVTAIDEIELKLEGYDKTEAVLVKSAGETAQAVSVLTTAFSEVNENFAAAQDEFEESQKFFEDMQISYNYMKKAYESALESEIIFESAEGSSMIETTRLITDFREIVIVYEVDADANLQSAYKNQKRLFTADIGEYFHLSETLPCNSTVNEDMLVVDVFVQNRVVNYGTSQASRFWLVRTNTSIAGQTATFKIYKIYGIGEVAK